MTPYHGSAHSAKLSSYQSELNKESLFNQQPMSEIIIPHSHNHPRTGSEKLKLGGHKVLACL